MKISNKLLVCLTAPFMIYGGSQRQSDSSPTNSVTTDKASEASRQEVSHGNSSHKVTSAAVCPHCNSDITLSAAASETTAMTEQAPEHSLVAANNTNSNKYSKKHNKKQQQPPVELTSTDPNVRGQTDFKITADFLYWKRSDGFEFISNGTGLETINPFFYFDVQEQGKDYFPSFDYRPGFRVGAGLDLAHDGWDLQLNYTWLYSKGHKTYPFTPSPPLPALPPKGFEIAFDWINALGGAPYGYDGASASQAQTLNWWTLELGRSFYTSKFLILRPSINVGVSYLPANIHVHYDYMDSVYSGETPTPVPARNLVDHYSKARGLGIGGGLGLNTEWLFTKHWGVLGNFLWQGLWTRHYARAKEIRTNLVSGVNVTDQKSKLTFHDVQWIREAFLALEWKTINQKSNYAVSIYAGWEFLLGFENFFVSNAAGMLSENSDFQGLRVGGKFDF